MLQIRLFQSVWKYMKQMNFWKNKLCRRETVVDDYVDGTAVKILSKINFSSRELLKTMKEQAGLHAFLVCGNVLTSPFCKATITVIPKTDVLMKERNIIYDINIKISRKR